MYEKSEFISVINRFLSFNSRQERLTESEMSSPIMGLGISEFDILTLTAKIFEELFGSTENKNVFSVKCQIFETSTYLQWYEAIEIEYNKTFSQANSNVVDLKAYARKREQSQTPTPEFSMPTSNQGSGFFISDKMAIAIENLPESKKQRKFLQYLMQVLEFPSKDEDILKEQINRAFSILK